MPTIPVANRSIVQTGPAAVFQDADALNAPNRALVSLGGALQNTAAVIGEFAERKQAQVNKGILASEETVRMETAAQIQSYIESNPDKPETWRKFSNDTWKAYEQGRAARMKTDKWAPLVQKEDALKYQSYRAEVGIHFRAAQDKAYIRQSNARLEANAQTKLRAGDYEGFVAAYDQMNLFPDQREDAIRRGLEEGMYKIANNQLDAIREMPPAQAIQATEQFMADLKEKDEKTGRFKNFEFDRGGLSIGGRVNIESIANARIREAQRQMDVTGRRLVGELRLGRATTADVKAALDAGELDEATAKALAPDMIQAQQERADRQAAKANKLEQQQEKALDRLRTDVLKRGEAGIREIERQVALSEISAAQGAKLKEELQQTSRSEQALENGDFASISERIKGGYAAKMFGRQPSDTEYRRLQNDIITAKVTKETRLKLMQQLFDLKLADMADLEEEGPEDGRFRDRDITPQERGLRRDLIEHYRAVMPALGDTLAGDLMFNQEARIRTFFDTAKGQRTQTEIEKFTKEQLLPEIQQAAGFEALKDAFNF